MGPRVPLAELDAVRQPRAASGLLALSLGGVYAMWTVLNLRLNVNWDEFHYLAYVYEGARGELAYRWATFHVHLFGWLTVITGTEVDQIIVARLALQGVAVASGIMIYRIARRVVVPEAATFTVLCYFAFTYVLRSGASFRPDPLCAFLLLVAVDGVLAPRGRLAAFLAGMAIALSTAITIKAWIHVSLLAAILATTVIWAGEARRRELARAIAFVAGLALTLPLLLAYHWSGLQAPAAFDGATESAPTLAAVFGKVFGGGVLFPRREVAAASLGPNAAIWLALVAGIVIAGAKALSSRDTERGRALLVLVFASPLLTIAFYRNAFPYYYVFVMPLAVVACGVAWQAIRDRGGSGARALLWNGLAVVLAASVFSGALAYFARHRFDATVVQRELLEVVHSAFPEPVAYIDRCSMVASFPKRGFFMSSWGIQRYRERGRPIFAELLREPDLAFLVANSESLRLEVPRPLLSRAWFSLLSEDVDVLAENFVHHWGPLWVRGKTFELAERGAVTFELPAGGRYTVESDGTLLLDGDPYRNGDVVELATGRHDAASAGARRVTLRWGDHLYRPSTPPEPFPVFLDF